jgi:hypothetical protein
MSGGKWQRVRAQQLRDNEGPDVDRSNAREGLGE